MSVFMPWRSYYKDKLGLCDGGWANRDNPAAHEITPLRMNVTMLALSAKSICPPAEVNDALYGKVTDISTQSAPGFHWPKQSCCRGPKRSST